MPSATASQHVDFPASAPTPSAAAVRAPRLAAPSSETVWNDGPGDGAAGGGISDVFPVPPIRRDASVPTSVNPGGHRPGVPDVCGDADPIPATQIRVDGQTDPVGGTSAVAPLWAGLVVLLNEGLGHSVGFLHPLLYSSAAAATLHDIVKGSNGAYSAGPGGTHAPDSDLPPAHCF